MKNEKITKEWILRSFSSELTHGSRKKLVEWLESDPVNREEYFRLKSIWEQSGRVLIANPDEFEASWQRFLVSIRKEKKTARTRLFLWSRIAASVALVAGLTATVIWLLPETRNHVEAVAAVGAEHTYIITPTGEKVILAEDQTEIRYDTTLAVRPAAAGNVARAEAPMLELVVPRSRRVSIVLSDGSRIRLNSESRLRYPEYFTGSTRTVSLEGEAFFEVSSDTAMPFIVATQRISVQVLGTTFNITAYTGENQISTTLVEGSVEVRQIGTDGVCLLKPSQRAVYSCASKTIEVGETDTELYTSWIHGYLKVRSESLDQVIQKLVRSYGVNMEITDESLKEYKFSGKLDLQETARQVLGVIQLTAPLAFTEENGTIKIQNKNE
jgi:ferric-dicitrate binding protein FerR (iron transport regulator)